jgi:hypothetical protein
MVASSLANRRKVGFRKGIVVNEFVVSGRKGKQSGTLNRRQQTATWHVQSPISGKFGKVLGTEILVKGFSADPELLGQPCPFLAGCGPSLKILDLEGI